MILDWCPKNLRSPSPKGFASNFFAIRGMNRVFCTYFKCEDRTYTAIIRYIRVLIAYYNLELLHRESVALVNVFTNIFVCVVPLQTRAVDSPYYQVYISMENVYVILVNRKQNE